LPVILWRKQTNAPNKFMGSGMLPAGAYVTLEHEYILLFRKDAKRKFPSIAEKAERMKSSFFWEERNRWFSDVWDFKGASQTLAHAELRSRSAAYPLELAYRLVLMYSLYEDTVLDPFMGTGTTALASIACARNSIGVEINPAFGQLIVNQATSFLPVANEMLLTRISAHQAFVSSHISSKGAMKYRNEPHGFPVVTRQELGIQLHRVVDISASGECSICARYAPVGRLDTSENIKKEKSKLRNSGSPQSALDF
jgi:DNA modification methylase